MSPKLVVFDLDGTLVDSASNILRLLNELREELGLDSLAYHEVIPWLSLGGEVLIEKSLNQVGSEMESYLLKFREKYKNTKTSEDSIYPEVRTLLEVLSERNFALAICTNKPRYLAEKVLKELSIDKYFSVMCADGDLATKKPHPANLIYCLNAFGVLPSESLFVGDSKVDQDLANSCGVPFAWFSAGYDDGVVEQNVSFEFNNYSLFRKYLLNNY